MFILRNTLITNRLWLSAFKTVKLYTPHVLANNKNNNMKKIIQLVLGGARSGKSTYAEAAAYQLYSDRKIASTTGQATAAKLIYLATATAGDAEMSERIDHHKQRRNEDWQLIEEQLDIANIVRAASSDTTILIDCLTLWLSNCLYKGVWLTQRNALIEALKTSNANIVMVSNEVGSGIVPMGELSRQFVDESGWLHQQIASIADKVDLIVAGLPLSLKDSCTTPIKTDSDRLNRS